MGPDPSFCNNAVLRQATRRLGQLYDRVLAPSGLRATQHGILAHLKAAPDPTMRQLADKLVMDLSALGHTLKPLMRDGYVELAANENDGRSRIVKLTPAGTKKFAETSRLWRNAQSKFEAVYGAKKADQLRTTLTFLASQDFGDAFEEATGLRR